MKTIITMMTMMICNRRSFTNRMLIYFIPIVGFGTSLSGLFRY